MGNQTCSSSYASSSYVSECRKEWEERRRQMKEQETEKIERIKEFLMSRRCGFPPFGATPLSP